MLGSKRNVVSIVLVFALIITAVALWPHEQPALAPEVSPSELVPAQSDTPAVNGSMVSYFEGVSGYLAEPAAPGDYPGVVMIHENRGLRPEIKLAAEELAAQGYRVLAVDLFKGTVMETQDEARAYREQYDPAYGLANMQAAAAYLRAQGAPKVASLGWCFGGAESLALSTSGADIDATVIYYGRLTDDREQLARLSSPVLGIFGDVDQVVPTSSVAVFEEQLSELGVPADIHLYTGVGHAFANPSNPNFAPTETADAWAKTLAFLNNHLR